VAACADHHLVVRKQLVKKATLSSVAAVCAQERVDELARMLGGETMMDSTMAHAKDMLQAQGT